MAYCCVYNLNLPHLLQANQLNLALYKFTSNLFYRHAKRQASSYSSSWVRGKNTQVAFLLHDPVYAISYTRQEVLFGCQEVRYRLVVGEARNLISNNLLGNKISLTTKVLTKLNPDSFQTLTQT